jgi:hypothetical protein
MRTGTIDTSGALSLPDGRAFWSHDLRYADQRRARREPSFRRACGVTTNPDEAHESIGERPPTGDDVEPRLDRLDDLTQKGVHEEPTAADVDFGVIHTYLIAGEVLQLTA